MAITLRLDHGRRRTYATAQGPITLADIRRHLGQQGVLGPTAIVVADDVTYGMLRMLQTLVEDVCLVWPFRSFPEAEAWLQRVETSVHKGQ